MVTTFKQAADHLRDHGIVVLRTGEGKEHRVNYKGGREETAYYTDDPADAHGTGMHMAKNVMKEHEHPYWGNPSSKGNIGEGNKTEVDKSLKKYGPNTYKGDPI